MHTRRQSATQQLAQLRFEPPLRGYRQRDGAVEIDSAGADDAQRGLRDNT